MARLASAALLGSVALVAFALVPSAVAATPVTVASVPAGADALVQLAGTAVPAPSLYGAQVLGRAQPSSALRLDIFLRPDDAAGLQSLAGAVSSPGNPAYHHFLTVPQFAGRFGAPAAQVAALDKYLTAQGLRVGPLSGDHLAQAVTGSAAELDRAFGTALVRLRTAQGDNVTGSTLVPRLPAHLAGAVTFVDGLEPWAQQVSNLVRFPPAPTGGHIWPGRARGGQVGQEQANADCSGMAAAGLTPSQLASAYGFNGFYDRGDEGQSETIGLIEYALPDPQAVSDYEACTGADLTIDYVPTGSPPKQTNAEVAADIEVVAALAPKATVVVYESNQAGTGLGGWELAVSGTASGGLPDVISDSWDACEPDTGMGSSYYQTEEALFDEAATQGQTVLVASGDDGSEGCVPETESKALAVDDPASAPMVTAVGGTASDTVAGPQYVWNSRGAAAANCLGTGCSVTGASGGGASTVWPRPGYQPASLPQAASCNLGVEGCREVPDVSALAGDPYAQYCSGRVCGGFGDWVGFGGTSLAAPAWGAAVMLSEPSCPTKIGFLNPLLYTEPTALTGAVTSGNNDLTGTNSGLYPASPSGGYSMAAGLGYLGGQDLTTGALCGASAGTGSSGNGTTSPGTTSGVMPTGSHGSPLPAHACSGPADVATVGQVQALAAEEGSDRCAGYWVVTGTGHVAAFGSAVVYSPQAAFRPKAPIVAIAATPDYRGYWLLASDGSVFAFGDAMTYGSRPSPHLSSPAVGMAVTPDGLGYWVVSRDGGVFAFGDAAFYGSMGSTHLDRPVIGIAATATGHGYWLVASDGGLFAFGDAVFHGSLAAAHLNRPVVGITAGPYGDGYRLVATDGGIFSFGAPFYGSLGGSPPPAPITSMAPSVDGHGYYLLDAAGHVYAYGDAPYLGNVTP
ncbi:MAG: protease pro-enzyme activation domain-containing protein [Acidimicrobiales bacterium]